MKNILTDFKELDFFLKKTKPENSEKFELRNMSLNSEFWEHSQNSDLELELQLKISLRGPNPLP